MVLDKYVLRLWLGSFLGGLAVVSGVLLLGRALKLLALVVDSGASWHILGDLLLFTLPYFMLLTIPMAFFFAMQAMISGLQQGSEMDAMRAAGLSYNRIFRSMIIMACLLSCLMLVTSMYWLPKGQLAFNNLLRQLSSLKGAPVLTPKRFTTEMGNEITFYVDGEDEEGRYHGVIVEDNRPGGLVLYTAEMAGLVREFDGMRMRMWNGTRLEGSGDDQRVLTFKHYDVALPLGKIGTLKPMHSGDHVVLMTASELWNQVHRHQNVAADAEWSRRLLLPTTALILCLFALPLSLSPKRAGRAGSFLLGVGLLILLYNMQLVLHRQSSQGVFPVWSMWAGQIGFLACGFFLWQKANQDRLPAWLLQGGEVFYLIHQWTIRLFARRMGKP